MINSADQKSRSMTGFESILPVWESVLQLELVDNDCKMVAMSDGVYFLGYSSQRGELSKRVRHYNMTTNKWTNLQPMLEARRTFAAVGHNGLIYVFGGVIRSRNPYTSHCEVYYPGKNKWEELPPIPSVCIGGTAVPVRTVTEFFSLTRID